MSEHWEKVLGSVAGIAGVLFGLYKRVKNEPRTSKETVISGRKPCRYGDENRELLSDLEADQRVVASQIRATQRQLDELFTRIRDVEQAHVERMREIEEKINLILGHIREHI